jgi:hypothetical protein
MTVQVRPAGVADVPVLVALMQEFYAEADYPLPAESASRAFDALLADSRLGSVWLAEDSAEAVAEAVRRGVRALQVEVGPDNHAARRMYARAGYADSGHLILSLPLASPIHAG